MLFCYGWKHLASAASNVNNQNCDVHNDRGICVCLSKRCRALVQSLVVNRSVYSAAARWLVLTLAQS